MLTSPDAPQPRLFRNRSFVCYWLVLVLTGFAVQIQTVAVGWHVYSRTGNPVDLGLVGLSQFLPALALVAVTGIAADRLPRRVIMTVSLLLMAAATVLLLLMAADEAAPIWPVFAIMGFYGLARAFYNPARVSIIPSLVPQPQLSQAIAANSSANEFATICGPVAGGLLYAIDPHVAYATAGTFLVLGAVLAWFGLPQIGAARSGAAGGLSALAGGFRFIRSHKPVLGAISLDLFAVLLGGATALLPIFADDILAIGPEGLGLLRAGPAIGALSMSLLLMARPIRDHAGWLMLGAVVIFGLATVVFAFSTLLWLSVVMLVIIGACDMISVNVRSVLIQIWTPDELRGRVSAVNQVFIGTSNEVGAFRAGVMAAWIGAVPAVAVGGAAIIGIAGAWAYLFPALRQVRQLR